MGPRVGYPGNLPTSMKTERLGMYRGYPVDYEYGLCISALARQFTTSDLTVHASITQKNRTKTNGRSRKTSFGIDRVITRTPRKILGRLVAISTDFFYPFYRVNVSFFQMTYLHY